MAAQVFTDPGAFVEQDRIKNGEDRWLAIGMVERFLLLTVAHMVYEQDHIETIRIISARRADRHERTRYEEANG